MPPENVQCSVLNAQSLHISWEAPLTEGRNGIIKGYKVTFHSVGEWFGKHTYIHIKLVKYSFILLVLDNDDQQTKIVNQLRTAISGLRKFTNYSMTVLAYTKSGDGVRSLPVYCQTEEDGKPIGLKCNNDDGFYSFFQFLPHLQPSRLL